MTASSYMGDWASWNPVASTPSIQDAEDFKRQSSACSTPATTASSYTPDTTNFELSVNTQQGFVPPFSNWPVGPHFNLAGQYLSYSSKNTPIGSGGRPSETSYTFTSTEELVQNYGIPADLPPPPRPPPRIHGSSPAQASPFADFAALNANYQAMRAQKPSEAAESTTDGSGSVDAADFTNFRDRSSPSYMTTGFGFEEQMSPPLVYADGSPQYPYLTSPVDTPLSDFLPTPHLEDDMLTGPIVIHDDSYPEMNLFGGVTTPSIHEMSKPPPTLLRGAQLYTISPEATPNLDAPQPTVPARKRPATGTRRNVTAANLIPLDAPTQKRTYVTESATSRKDIDTKKRAHGAESEQDAAVDALVCRRRKNTVAARLSRKRKLEHQQALEVKSAKLERKNARLKRRALQLKALCRVGGIAYPPSEDDSDGEV